MKTDYITSGTPLPPSLAFPLFLLGASVRFTAKEVYTILLDMTLNSEDVQTVISAASWSRARIH